MILLLILFFHLALACLLSVEIFHGRLKVDRTSVVLLFLLPGFGEILVCLASARHTRGTAGRKAEEINRRKDYRENSASGFFDMDLRDTAIPLEDALIINNGAERQRILRDAVLAGTNGQSAFLQQAKRDQNPEIVHFATTAMAHADSEYEKRLSSLEEKLKENPENLETLDTLIDHLWEYLKNPSEDEAIRSLRQKRYIEVLKERVSLHPAPEFLTKLASAYIDSDRYQEAEEALNLEDSLFPNDPDTWITRFSLYYKQGDREEMNHMIETYKAGQQLRSSRIDRIISFWTGRG